VVGHGAVAMLMRRAGLAGATGRPKWRHAKPDQIAADLVDRQFARTGPNQLWVTDITEHPTREGKVYCAVVLDAYSRRVVGWSIDASPTAALVTNALGMAINARTPPTGGIIYSDQGVQFASWAFTQRAKDSGLLPSMGSVGDCYDNSMIEAFWSRMQVELLDRRRWKTRVELANAIFEYLEIFHNRQRRHSSLGMLTRYSSRTHPPWHERPATRLHETQGRPEPPVNPGRVNGVRRRAWGARLHGCRRHWRPRRASAGSWVESSTAGWGCRLLLEGSRCGCGTDR
jgi:putative transposase